MYLLKLALCASDVFAIQEANTRPIIKDYESVNDSMLLAITINVFSVPTCTCTCTYRSIKFQLRSHHFIQFSI